MNICYLSAEEPVVGRGGVDAVAVKLTEAFESCGHFVFHIVWKHNKNGGAGSVRGTTFLPNKKHFDTSENADFFGKFLRSKAIDCVIFAWGIGKKFPFWMETRKLGIPVAALFHSDPTFYKFRYRFFERIRRHFSQRSKYRWNADYCDALVVLGTKAVEKLRKYLRDDQQNTLIRVIGNPANFPVWKDYTFASKQKEVLMVGLDLYAKRPDFLLKVWQQVSRKHPDWSLNLLGGNDKEILKLKKIAGALELRRVYFHGFQNPVDFYKRASIFCMTSAYEGFPMVLTEAAAFGCVPVVFDSLDAAHDIIDDGENGELVPAFDLDAYARTLEQLMSDDTLREHLARNAQRDVERFSLEKIIQKWLQLFKELK